MRDFEVTSQHYIVCKILVSHLVIWEVEEQGPVESTSVLMEKTQFSVIVVDESQLRLLSCTNEIRVSLLWILCRRLVEIVRLLQLLMQIVVVPGERVVSTDLVPPSAKLCRGVADETTDV